MSGKTQKIGGPLTLQPLRKNLLEFFKTLSWISPGNWLGWICSHPAVNAGIYSLVTL